MVKQAASRDDCDARAAFEGEVLPHADRLFRLAMWFVRNRADAEDVVQDTMMQALKSFHRFQSGTNCRAWLTRSFNTSSVTGDGRADRSS
jgi:RNA polymerase sigma-70 factor (ECF subfamily)